MRHLVDSPAIEFLASSYLPTLLPPKVNYEDLCLIRRNTIYVILLCCCLCTAGSAPVQECLFYVEISLFGDLFWREYAQCIGMYGLPKIVEI